jgi:hypothetical protein
VKGETPCTSILRAVEKGYTLHVHTAAVEKGYTLLVHIAGDGRGYTLHIHTIGTGVGKRNTHCTSKLQVVESNTPGLHLHRRLLMVLFLLYDAEKSYINAGMPETAISSGSQLLQSGIGIPASGSVRYRWSRVSPALPSYGSYPDVD